MGKMKEIWTSIDFEYCFECEVDLKNGCCSNCETDYNQYV